MLYRQAGKTGEVLSILGFGCMRLPIRSDGVCWSIFSIEVSGSGNMLDSILCCIDKPERLAKCSRSWALAACACRSDLMESAGAFSRLKYQGQAICSTVSYVVSTSRKDWRSALDPGLWLHAPADQI